MEKPSGDHLEEDLKPESSFPLNWSEHKNNYKHITIEEIFESTIDFSNFKLTTVGVWSKPHLRICAFPCAVSFYRCDFNRHIIYNYISFLSSVLQKKIVITKSYTLSNCRQPNTQCSYLIITILSLAHRKT